MSNSRHFKVDARVLLSLGRESIKDHTTALVELVKNAYDADAQRVDIEIAGSEGSQDEQFIRVADNGHGMAEEDIATKWLRIGYSDKRINRVSKKGRRETGEKGIGRLSADRLGARLKLLSKKESKPPIGILVDWDQFDRDGADLASIEVRTIPSPLPNLPPPQEEGATATGTEILIEDLRQLWTPEDIDRLEEELSSLLSPDLSQDVMQIWLKRPNGALERLRSSVDDAAELTLDATFDVRGRMTYTITGKPLHQGTKRHTIKSGRIPWEDGTGNAALLDYNIGSAQVSISFYLRSAASLTNGMTLSQLRSYLNRNAGVRIYRDNIRVKPYGDLDHPEGDWLGLAVRKNRDPAGASRATFRLAPNQVVGAVYIGRDTNKLLLDSAAREGLVQGTAYSVLKSAVYRCITLLESTYHATFSEAKKTTAAQADSIPAVVSSMKTTLEDLTKGITRVGEPKKILAETAAKLRAVTDTFRRAEQRFEDFANESVVYRGLATVGISSAVFGHETESALAQAKMATSVVLGELSIDDPDLDTCLEEITKVKDSVARVDLWGQFSLTRIKRDKRRRTDVNVSELLFSLSNELKPLFKAKNIVLTNRISPDLRIRGFAMDIESVALNLLTNAYHHAGLRRKDREVRLTLKRTLKNEAPGLRLIVEDSGHGISKENLGRIWDPLFSTKSDHRGNLVGTGLGLSIVQSIIREMDATVLTKGKGDLGGATIEVTMPLRSLQGK